MKEYILHRCLLMIPTVLGVSLIVFLLMHFIPGDPISILMGDYYTPEAAATIRAKYGLDRPLHSQYVLWLGRMITGDWGYSIIANRPIFDDLVRRFPITIELVILAMGFALLIAIPAGVLASLHPYSWRDYGRAFASGGSLLRSWFPCGTFLPWTPHPFHPASINSAWLCRGSAR